MTTTRNKDTLSPRLKRAVASLLLADQRATAFGRLGHDHDLKLKNALKIAKCYAEPRSVGRPHRENHRPLLALLLAAAIVLAISIEFAAIVF